MNFLRREILQELICIFAVLFSTFFSLQGQDFIQKDFRVSDSTGYNYTQPSLSAGNQSNLAFAWENVGDGGIWLKTAGLPNLEISPVIRVTSPFYHDHTVLCHNPGGSFLLAYLGYGSKWDVYAQAYDHNGSEVGDTLTVSQGFDGFIDGTVLNVVIDKQDHFVVLFSASDSIMVRKISNTGEPVGALLSLKPGTTSAKTELQGVVNHRGGYLVSWLDIGTGNIYTQVFDEEGNSLSGPTLAVQKETDHNITAHRLKCDTAGNYVIGWVDIFNSNESLNVQFFNNSGEKIGDKVKVTDNDAIYAGYASLDMDLDGNVVVAWNDEREEGLTAIYLQQVDNKGKPVRGNYPATSINREVSGGNLEGMEQDPIVMIRRDTIYLAWTNFNSVLNYTSEIYANVLEWIEPDISGIKDEPVKSPEFSIYPNPSEGQVFIRCENSFPGISEVEVFNNLGVRMYHERIYDFATLKTIDLEMAPEGLYYLKISGNGFYKVYPLVIGR